MFPVLIGKRNDTNLFLSRKFFGGLYAFGINVTGLIESNIYLPLVEGYIKAKV